MTEKWPFFVNHFKNVLNILNSKILNFLKLSILGLFPLPLTLKNCRQSFADKER